MGERIRREDLHFRAARAGESLDWSPLKGAAQACWGVHAWIPAAPGSFPCWQQLGAGSGLSLGLRWRQSSHVSLLPASLNSAATQGEPLTCTISLQINLKFHISVISVGVQMTGSGPAGQEARSEDRERRTVPSWL